MIFLDASFIIGLFVKKVKWHDRAIEINKIIENDDKIISKLVITEVMTVLNVNLKQDKKLIKKVYEFLNNDFKVVDDYKLFNKSFEKLISNKKRISFYDCMYLTIMEEIGISKIVSFDSDFDNEKIERIH